MPAPVSGLRAGLGVRRSNEARGGCRAAPAAGTPAARSLKTKCHGTGPARSCTRTGADHPGDRDCLSGLLESAVPSGPSRPGPSHDSQSRSPRVGAWAQHQWSLGSPRHDAPKLSLSAPRHFPGNWQARAASSHRGSTGDRRRCTPWARRSGPAGKHRPGSAAPPRGGCGVSRRNGGAGYGAGPGPLLAAPPRRAGRPPAAQGLSPPRGAPPAHAHGPAAQLDAPPPHPRPPESPRPAAARPAPPPALPRPPCCPHTHPAAGPRQEGAGGSRGSRGRLPARTRPRIRPLSRRRRRRRRPPSPAAPPAPWAGWRRGRVADVRRVPPRLVSSPRTRDNLHARTRTGGRGTSAARSTAGGDVLRGRARRRGRIGVAGRQGGEGG